MRSVVTIAASSRPHSLTGRAVAVVNEEFLRLGFDVHTFDGGVLDLGFPGRAATEDGRQLKAAVQNAAGVVLATPEYHGGMSAMAKLVIENLGYPSALNGKPVALLGVAAGRIGAIKSIEQLRGIAGHIGALVVPGSVSIANVTAAFDATGQVTDAGTADALRGLAKALDAFMTNYVCPKYVMEAAVRDGAVVPPWTTTV